MKTAICVWSLAALLTGCSTFKVKPTLGVTYDLFSKQAKFEFSLAPGSKGKAVVPPVK
jgi:hypothetical protein